MIVVFGKKKRRKMKKNKQPGTEHLLNYTAQRYQLTRPSKVSPVMDLIRQVKPKNKKEWMDYYWGHAKTKNNHPITKKSLNQLGDILYEKMHKIIKKEFLSAFKKIDKKTCRDYIYDVVINRTYDGYNRECAVVYKILSKRFPQILFNESDSELDHAGDIDFIGKINEKYSIGIQIKPLTSKSGYGSYNPEDRMLNNFLNFEKKYKGKVYILYCDKKKLQNNSILDEIEKDISDIS
jgi:hypothetical protein